MNESNDRPSRDDVRDAAIEWWVSSRAGFSPEERATFKAWLSADPANAAAYADIVRTFEQAREARRARPAQALPSTPRPRRFATAAAALAATGLVLFFAFDDLSIFLRSDFATGTAETRTIALADGSQLTLDARSAISVRFDTEQRHVTLLEGEGWFEVSKDHTRPFVVEARGGTITALGTAFEVALGQGAVRVSVAEHQVMVASHGETVIVAENQQTSYDTNAPPAPPSAAPRSVAAWRRGKLIFEDQPLGEVLAALSRYHHGRVYCVTAAACARPVTGVFSTDNPLQALREIELFLGLHAVHLMNYLVLLY